jgi:hypothetical protein
VSLIDPKDIIVRNFGRPVSAVALSPNFKSDRSYLSGGLAGHLIYTIGGKVGVKETATTVSAAAAASGWFSSIGLGPSAGRDNIIHSGEGAISTIKWSLSGKFVVWANEKGVKIMRSNLHLESGDADYAWSRLAHIDRPNRPQWEEMAGVWKARAEWLSDSALEHDEDASASNGHDNDALSTATPKPARTSKRRLEKLVVGWGDSVWVLHVKPESKSTAKDGKKLNGTAFIVHHLLFDDCIVSGVLLYTPSLLLVLAYRIKDDDDKPMPITTETTPRRGVHNRQTGLSPELRLIDVHTKEEADVDTLTMSRYESLTAADYHLGTLYIPAVSTTAQSSRGALDALGGIWDASINASVNATRLFSSAASTRSTTGSTDTAVPSPSLRPTNATKPIPPPTTKSTSSSLPSDLLPAVKTPGLKIFIQSPYDCVLASKRDLSDHLSWLVEHTEYKKAFELVQDHPEAVTVTNDDIASEDAPSTPTKHSRQSLRDFFLDDRASQTTVSATKVRNKNVDNEKRRIGELWLQQLVDNESWSEAGQLTSRVLGNSPRWDHWIRTFAKGNHFDEITPYIPTKLLHPSLSSEVYELVLQHYIDTNRLRFKELMDAWDTYLYRVDIVISAIEDKLVKSDISEDSVEDGIQGRDWRILVEALAKLNLAASRPTESLRYYIRLQNSDAAMALIGEYHLVEAVADDIPAFLTLKVSKEQLKSAPLAELDYASSDAVRLLVDESLTGLVKPNVVVEQLQAKDKSYRPFLYLYLRALWKGNATEARPLRIHQQQLESEGRTHVEQYGDLAASLFADYDQTLFMEFLRASRSYSYEKATTLCEEKHYYRELVYLYSQTGQTKRALNLIINSLGDVKFAIEFAREQNDHELWDDLLEFSMDKPRFIIGLLEEVGTSIDPIKLVKRIPEGLEIQGLRAAIGRMLREYEIQGSISEGVARVLRGEVASGMEILRSGRAKAIKFRILEKDVIDNEVKEVPNGKSETKDAELKPVLKPGHCVHCHKPFQLDGKNDPVIQIDT